MISVCLATHNGSKYIKEQIDSVIKQLNDDDELIISDDGSTDTTLDIISSYNDSRIILLNYKSVPRDYPFEYATYNFENALKKAKGEYIFLCDQDDVWLDNKVEVSMKYLQEYDYIVSDAYITDSELNVISDTRFTKEEKICFNKYLAVVLSTPYQGSCAAFKRCILDKAMPFPKGTQSHDRWIGHVAAFYFKYKIIPERLIYYRRHESTTSNSFGTDGRSSGLLKTIGYKLGYIKGLLSIMGK